MSIYRFECEQCGKQFEELTAYSQRETVTCPTCGGQTKVLVTGFAVKGKGTGTSIASPAPRSGFS